MSVLDRAHQLASVGQRGAAIALIEGAAVNDDPEALFAIANWRLYGMNGPRDVAEAHRLLDRAVALGDVEATRLKANLVGNGTGGAPNSENAARLLETISDRDPLAAMQLRLLSKSREAGSRNEDRLSADPDIRVYRALLDRDECDYLVARAQPELRPSFVVDPRTGGQMPHPTRTSFGMNFDPAMEDPVVRQLNCRFAEVTGTTVECGEPLHVLRYAPGQEYRPHFDAIPGAANQRTWTVLVYLNDAYQGGATLFDRLATEFRGGPGDALVFRNADEHGSPDSRLRHAGMPVKAGVKWLATRWIRAEPHDPWTASY
ncbi:MAG: 2OG-Fe(II) oxygenase [Sphingomicrobium sp.]